MDLVASFNSYDYGDLWWFKKQTNQQEKRWQCDSEWQKSKVIKKNTIAIVTKICDSLN